MSRADGPERRQGTEDLQGKSVSRLSRRETACHEQVKRDTTGGSILRRKRPVPLPSCLRRADRALPLQRSQSGKITLCLLTTRGFPPTRAGVRALRPSPRPRFGPSALLATAQRFCKQGGTVEYFQCFTPEFTSGVKHFSFHPNHQGGKHHGRRESVHL